MKAFAASSPPSSQSAPIKRFDHVAEHVVAVEGAVVAGLLAKPHLAGELEIARDLGAGARARRGR